MSDDDDQKVSSETRSRPGPSSYKVGELVEVKLPTPDSKERTWYLARIHKASRKQLTVRVVGTGTEHTFDVWPTRWFVRRPSAPPAP